MTRKAPTKTHRQMVEEWKREPEFREAYDELDMEFTLLRELLLARQHAGLTQAEVAEKMGTKPPAVTRLETALSDQKHSPTPINWVFGGLLMSLDTLTRFAVI